MRSLIGRGHPPAPPAPSPSPVFTHVVPAAAAPRVFTHVGRAGPVGFGGFALVALVAPREVHVLAGAAGRKNDKNIYLQKKKKGLMRSSPPPHTLYLKFFGGEIKNSRVWALPVAGALLAAPAAGEAAPVAAAGAAVAAAEAAASHGACGEFWGEKRGILGLPQRSRTQLATHLPGRGRPGRLRRRG